MATKTVLIDDLDGTEASEFGIILRLNDKIVILDLSDDNWKRLNDVLEGFLAAGTPWTEPAPAPKRKLNHDERNSLLSWGRHVKGIEIKRITQEQIEEWAEYIEARDKGLLQKMDDRATQHASEAAIEAALTAGEAIKEAAEDAPAPSPEASTKPAAAPTQRRGRQRV